MLDECIDNKNYFEKQCGEFNITLDKIIKSIDKENVCQNKLMINSLDESFKKHENNNIGIFKKVEKIYGKNQAYLKNNEYYNTFKIEYIKTYEDRKNKMSELYNSLEEIADNIKDVD